MLAPFLNDITLSDVQCTCDFFTQNLSAFGFKLMKTKTKQHIFSNRRDLNPQHREQNDYMTFYEGHCSIHAVNCDLYPGICN